MDEDNTWRDLIKSAQSLLNCLCTACFPKPIQSAVIKTTVPLSQSKHKNYCHILGTFSAVLSENMIQRYQILCGMSVGIGILNGCEE